jgi:glycosyltransferase involved in cell wall biosynthesis
MSGPHRTTRRERQSEHEHLFPTAHHHITGSPAEMTLDTSMWGHMSKYRSEPPGMPQIGRGGGAQAPSPNGSIWMQGAFRPGLVSVVIPVFNREQYVHETLDSIRRQDYRPIEIMVVDDGSNDGTSHVVERWLDANWESDLHLQLIRQPNLGVDTARNAGLQASSGEFIQFLDSDDLLHPNKLSECVLRFAGNLADTVVCRHAVFRNIHEITDVLNAQPKYSAFTSDPERRPFYTRMGWELWLPLYRRILLCRAGPMSSGIMAGGAYAYTTRLKLLSTGRRYAPYTLVFYRKGASNALTALQAPLRVPATAQVMRQVLNTLEEFEVTDRAEWQHLAKKALTAYRKSIVKKVPESGDALIGVARIAARRARPWIGALLYTPQPVLRTGIRTAATLSALIKSSGTQ